MTKHNKECNCNYCKHIEKCVLMHDELIKTLENLLTTCEEMRLGWSECNLVDGWDEIEKTKEEIEARKILIKAKG